MNKENIPIERQISKVIKATKCTFKLHGDILNVVEVNGISIFPIQNKGDFGVWNTRYRGYAQITVTNGINNCTKSHNIEGYAKIEDNTVMDIDKTISVYPQ